MFRDILGQAWEATRHHRRRSLLTVLGMAWGLATVILLLAYGAGFARAFETIFAQFGTTLIGVFPGRTSEQAGGQKAGAEVRLEQADVERLRSSVGSLEEISPMVSATVPVQSELRNYNWSVNGMRPNATEVLNLRAEEGRFFSAAEDEQRAHVAVIGSEARAKLFAGGYALGERIRLKGVSFTVVGVLKAKMQEGDDDNNRQIYIPFNTMSDLKDTRYLDGIWFTFTGDYNAVERQARQALAAAHRFRATDRNAVNVANLMVQLSEFRMLAVGLEILLTMIGALTLGIAGIGLMNILLVSVQQRTREIGVEKALGARRRHILLQFLAEAMVITAAGGVLGIALAYAVSLGVGRIPFYSAIAANATDADIRLLISARSVAVSTAILAAVGLLSGMIPALRAASLSPMEALRYE